MKITVVGVICLLANGLNTFAAQPPCDVGTWEEKQLTTNDSLVEAPKVGSEMFFVLGVSRREVGDKFEAWLKESKLQEFSQRPGGFYFNALCEMFKRLNPDQEPDEEQMCKDMRRYLEHCRIWHPYGEFKGTEDIIGFIAYAFNVNVKILEKVGNLYCSFGKEQIWVKKIRSYNPKTTHSADNRVEVMVEKGRVYHLVIESSLFLERKRAQYLKGISELSAALLQDIKFLWRIQKHYDPVFQAHLFCLDTYIFFVNTFGWKRSDFAGDEGVQLTDEQHAVEKFKTEFLPYFSWWNDRESFITIAAKYYQLKKEVVWPLIPTEETHDDE